MKSRIIDILLMAFGSFAYIVFFNKDSAPVFSQSTLFQILISVALGCLLRSAFNAWIAKKAGL
jgi:hypothetical protein